MRRMTASQQYYEHRRNVGSISPGYTNLPVKD